MTVASTGTSQSLFAPTYGSGPQVRVVCNGGRFDFGQFSNGHSSPSGRNFLIVFNTAQTVTIAPTTDGRPWFGSILAPFAEVVVDPAVGFIDGVVIARSYRESPSGSGVQLHGYTFRSDSVISCGNQVCTNAGSFVYGGATGPSAGTAGCVNRWKQQKCERKVKKNKCHKRKVMTQCKLTCGRCSG